MNRLACRVMVAVDGMAVLGMTATLADAQTHPATYTPNDVMQAPFASDMRAGDRLCGARAESPPIANWSPNKIL